MALRTALLTALCALAVAGSAAASNPAPAAAPNTAASGAGAAAPPVDIPGAVAMLQLFNATAKPISRDSDAYLNIALDGGRTELVYVSGQVWGLQDSPVREARAVADKIKGAIDPALAQRLLTENQSVLGYGAWGVTVDADGTTTIWLQGDIPTSASATVVQEAISSIATRADKLEAELTGKDDF